jgi:hypothetical protein
MSNDKCVRLVHKLQVHIERLFIFGDTLVENCGNDYLKEQWEKLKEEVEVDL